MLQYHMNASRLLARWRFSFIRPRTRVDGIGYVRPKTKEDPFALIIKKYFNEHKAYFNLNYKEVHLYIDLNESLVKEGREYVHLLVISKTI